MMQFELVTCFKLHASLDLRDDVIMWLKVGHHS